jgi:ankyrin repeat protein
LRVPLVFLLVCSFARADEGEISLRAYRAYEKRAVALVKATSVTVIDADQPNQPFEEWLRQLAGIGAKFEWELNDCGEQSGGPADRERDLPLCVGATATLPDGRWIYAAVGVANVSDMRRKILPRRPGLRDVFAGYGKQTFLSGSKLAELRKFLGDDSVNVRLLAAAAAGDVPTLRKLLQQGADANFGIDYTPLMQAADHGKLPVIPILLEAGADINARSKGGDTALSLAVRKRHSDIVSLLLAREVSHETKNLALLTAAGSKSLPLVQALLAAGADVNATAGFDISPLMWACEADNPDVVRALLEAGAQVNAKSAFGTTPLSYCAERAGSSSMLMLLDHGAEARPEGAVSPLIAAARRGSIENVRLLLERGVDVNATARGSGNTALMEAVLYGRLDAVQLLLEKGADPNLSSRGFTALSLATSRGHKKIVEALRTAGAKQ